MHGLAVGTDGASVDRGHGLERVAVVHVYCGKASRVELGLRRKQDSSLPTTNNVRRCLIHRGIVECESTI